MGELTRREKLFVQLHILNGLPQWEAAKRAGYRGNRRQLATVGSQVANKPHIKAASAQLMEEVAREAGVMTKEEIISILSEQARNPIMSRFLRPDGTIDLPGVLEAGLGHYIKSIRQTKYGLYIQVFDAQKALELMGRYYGMWTDRVEVAGKQEVTVRVVYDTPDEPIDVEYDRGASRLLADTGDNDQCE